MAHRTLRAEPGEGERPRPVITRFLRYQQRDQVLALARNRGPPVHQGQSIFIVPDRSSERAKKRATFLTIKSTPHKREATVVQLQTHMQKTLGTLSQSGSVYRQRQLRESLALLELDFVEFREFTQETRGNKSGGNKSGGNKSGGNKSGGNKSGGNKSGGNKSGGNKSGGNKRRHKTQTEPQQHQTTEEVTSRLEAPVLLHGIFKLGKKSHDVLLTRIQVSWTPIIPETPTGHIEKVRRMECVSLKDVFAVKVKRRRVRGQQTGGAVMGVTLFCCRRRGLRLTEDSIHLHNTSIDYCHTWYTTLKDLLRGFNSRPRYLKVFINPASHKKEAVYIYREEVAPLFSMADIQTDITVTERKGHALSVLKECRLDEYDGVVCVGGDGSVAEVAHALVLRAQLDASRQPDSDPNPLRAALPLGIIPAGSTDVVSCSVHGVRHAVTAAMHIVLGHLQQVDMCGFHSLGHLVTFGFSAMFGFGGRSLALAERKRWLPPTQRHEFAMVKTLARLMPEECQLSFLPAQKNHSNLFEQRSKEQNPDPDPDPEPERAGSWRTNQGLYLNISIMSIPCLSPHTPRGLAPITRLANGSAALISVGNTSRSEFIKHLKKYRESSGQFSFSFVETHSVSAVRLRPRVLVRDKEEEVSKTAPTIQSERAFPWNIDGELVEISSEVEIRVHPRLITLYGEEVDEADDVPVTCGCI
ncbi:ceramide kinase-like protein [Lampris incognitus]|uniref:ceramide kinase-like protein n=1 Tax=Lampris incognitus TaxID=2546036 RepID=UPI0024B48C06|nr:ceramide kinase-like protein [Lampris incognitus]